MSDPSTIQSSTDSTAFYCNMNAMTAEQRIHHAEIWQRLESAKQETQALDNGFGFRYPADCWMDAAEFVSFERLCCPFFQFILELTPDNGSVWLKLTGSAGVK